MVGLRGYVTLCVFVQWLCVCVRAHAHAHFPSKSSCSFQ